MQRASELHLLVHFLDFLNSWGWARSSNPCGWQGPRCFPKEPAQAQPPDVPCRPPEGCVPLLWGQAPATVVFCVPLGALGTLSQLRATGHCILR